MTLGEIKRLDAGKWFDRKFAGTRVPTLDEVLEWSKGRLGILLEMKNAPERDPKFIDEVIATIERNNAADYVLPAGFDHPSLAEVHRRRPQWTLEMIMNCRLCDTVHAAKAAGCTLISLEPEYAVKQDTEEMHRAGLAVLTTLLSIEHSRELLDMGIDFFEANATIGDPHSIKLAQTDSRNPSERIRARVSKAPSDNMEARFIRPPLVL